MWFWEKLKDLGGACIGIAELFGLVYPVKTYMFQVDETLWRGSRLPDNAAYQELKDQGFTLLINLCAENDMDAEMCDRLGIVHCRVPILDNTAPSMDQMLYFLKFMVGNPVSKVFVHCEAGRGRTGCAVAVYRLAVCGWCLEDALAEAKKFGLELECQETFLKKFAVDGVKQWRQLNSQLLDY